MEVAISTALLHGTDAAHATVAFVTAALIKNDLARRFFGACKHAAHHHARCTRRNGFGNVAAVTNTTIGNQGNTTALQSHGHVINGSDLRNTHTGHNACGANRAWTDAHFHAIGTRLYQSQGGSTGGDIAAHHINVWVVLFHPTYTLNHTMAVTMRRVHHDGVHTRFNQCSHPLFGTWSHAHRSADP